MALLHQSLRRLGPRTVPKRLGARESVNGVGSGRRNQGSMMTVRSLASVVPACPASILPASTVVALGNTSTPASLILRSYSSSPPRWIEAAATALKTTAGDVDDDEVYSSPPQSSPPPPPPSPSSTPTAAAPPPVAPRLPTRHSVHLPQTFCTDQNELTELTDRLMQDGKAAAAAVNADDPVLLDRHRQLVLFVLRGHASNIPHTLWSHQKQHHEGGDNSNSSSDAMMASSLQAMIDLLDVLVERDQIQQELADRKAQAAAGGGMNGLPHETQEGNEGDQDDDEDEKIEIGTATFGEAFDQFSSIIEQKHLHEQELEEKMMGGHEKNEWETLQEAMELAEEFVEEEDMDDDLDMGAVGTTASITAVTTVAMYDTLLDAIAGASQAMVEGKPIDDDAVVQFLTPSMVHHVAEMALATASDDDPPTLVTYNAALRAVANLATHAKPVATSQEQLRDESLAAGFRLYNFLTHDSYGLQRNARSFFYLLQLVQSTMPASRVRGNITVTLWHQASREGVATPRLVERVVRDLHGCNIKLDDDSLNKNDNHSLSSINGPEFGVFCQALVDTLQSRGKELTGDVDRDYVIVPARFARFAKKYSHSHPALLY